jgi:hypothetical protein
MSYLSPVVCRRAHVLFISSCMYEGPCLIYIICCCLRIVVILYRIHLAMTVIRTDDVSGDDNH